MAMIDFVLAACDEAFGASVEYRPGDGPAIEDILVSSSMH